MRSFLRDIWKTAPKDRRPLWKEFKEKVRSGQIKIIRKKDFGKNVEKKGE